MNKMDLAERVTHVMAGTLGLPHDRVWELFNGALRKNHWRLNKALVDLLAWWAVEMEQKEAQTDVL